MGGFMKIKGVFVAASLVSITPAWAQDDVFMAIAYSPATRTVGLAVDKSSREEAESAAVIECREMAGRRSADCKAVMWVKNGCAGVAISGNGAWGSDWAPKALEADQKTVEKCRQYAKRSTCKIARHACTSNAKE
jgi:uncharacterized protein DUF4189